MAHHKESTDDILCGTFSQIEAAHKHLQFHIKVKQGKGADIERIEDSVSKETAVLGQRVISKTRKFGFIFWTRRNGKTILVSFCIIVCSARPQESVVKPYTFLS